MTRPRHPPAIESVASVAERLAVLLAAGVSPRAAWGHLADEGAREQHPGEEGGSDDSDSAERAVHTVIERVAAAPDGSDLAAAIAGEPAESVSSDGSGSLRRLHSTRRRSLVVRPSRAWAGARHAVGGSGLVADRTEAWRALAAAWLVASEAGAPLAGTLRILAGAFRAIGQREREINVALAGPRATARVVVALPFVSILFGLGMGFDTLGVLFTSGPGLVCLIAGCSLVFAGARWNRALVARATPKDASPGLDLDLIAVGMSGGVSVGRARELVAVSTRRFGIETANTSPIIDRVLALSVRAGVPAAELLRSEAERFRRDVGFATQQKAAALAVTLMLPLGCCVLPSFLLLGVAPVLIALVSSTIGSLS